MAPRRTVSHPRILGVEENGRAKAQAPGAQKPISFFTVPDVAEHLGVSTRTVRRWIDDEELVAHKFGRAVRISEGDLREFLAAHRGWRRRLLLS